MNTKTILGQFCLKSLDPRFTTPFPLEKSKLLIGSSPTADICLPDKSISSQHIFICLSGADGLLVKDLYSEVGTFVNGKRIQDGFITQGDILTIGTLSFSVEESEVEFHVTNPDASICPVSPSEISSIEIPSQEGLIYIDNEYCDIQFDESHYVPLKNFPLTQFSGDYVELSSSADVLDIAHNVQTKKLEVVNYMNGMMMDVTYLDLLDGEYSLSPKRKSKKDILFYTSELTKIFTIKNGQLSFIPQVQITPSVPWDMITLDRPVFLTKGAEQISLRFIETTTKWHGIPLFYRSKEFYQQTAKVFMGVFLPMLLLLFFSVSKNENDQETLAVIYKLPEQMKKPTESQEKVEVKAEELTSKTENTGHKDNQQNPSKVEFAAASQNQKIVAKSTAPQAASAPAQTTPVKAYEFKSSVAMDSIVGEEPKMNTNGSTSKSSVSDAAFNAGSSDDGALVAGANIGVSKFNGSDKSGSGSGSYGSRGLAAKSGFDSSYLEQKTVVLGSMDPELLRKIIREYIPQFRHCYQQELIANSDKIKGVIDLNFTIGPEGKVEKHDIRAKDARFSKKGIGCMGQVLAIIDFPRPKGGGVVDVKQPLSFFAETEKI